MPPRYVPWKEKHKPPAGFGTWCPHMPETRPQELLDLAVPDGEDAASTKLYAADGDWCFVAQPSDNEGTIYHGYPVPGSEVPERVLRSLCEAGRITRGDMNRLRRQKQLPDEYP